MKFSFILLTTFIFVISTGCATRLDGKTYSREQARKIQTVRYGSIIDMEPVTLDGTNTPVGALSGAIIGSIAGGSFGKGNGSAILSVLGAVIGGVAGNAVEKDITKSQATEFTIQLEKTGRNIIIVQENEENTHFHVGDNIKIISVDGKSRVRGIKRHQH